MLRELFDRHLSSLEAVHGNVGSPADMENMNVSLKLHMEPASGFDQSEIPFV